VERREKRKTKGKRARGGPRLHGPAWPLGHAPSRSEDRSPPPFASTLGRNRRRTGGVVQGLTCKWRRAPAEAGRGGGEVGLSRDGSGRVLLLSKLFPPMAFACSSFRPAPRRRSPANLGGEKGALGRPGGGERTVMEGEGKRTPGRAPSARNPHGDHAGEPCSGELRAEGCLGTLGEVFWERREWCVRSGVGGVRFI
jgi:hypothetical protein